MSKRYRANGKESFELTPIQIAARNDFAAGLKIGRFQTIDASCPMCGGSTQHCVSEKDTYGLPVRVVMCKECGLIYNSPRLSDQSLPRFYGEIFRKLDRVLPSHSEYFELEMTKGRRIFEFLESSGLLAQLEGALIVDVGCGAGGVLKYFEQKGYSVIGCDLVQENVNYGKSEHKLNLHYGNLDDVMQIIRDEEINVGLVIYEQVFEHLPDPGAELKKLHGKLAEDSLLYIGIPGLRNIDYQYGSDFLRFLQLPHLVHYDLEHLRALAARNGFMCLAGNEVAQAVFKKSPDFLSDLPYSSIPMSEFLEQLEARRKKRVLSETINNFPSNVLPFTRRTLEKSPLPRFVKAPLLYVLTKIKRLLF